VGPRADLDVCGKSAPPPPPPRDSIPGPSSPQRDAILTALSRSIETYESETNRVRGCGLVSSDC